MKKNINKILEQREQRQDAAQLQQYINRENMWKPCRAKNNNFVHNLDVLSLLFGSLLGDSWAECRNKNTSSIRFILQQENSNVEFLFWFYQYLALRGYCSSKTPIKYTRISLKNKVRYYYKISTYSFSNLKWLYDAFYKNKIKEIPNNETLEKLLTPLAIAVWFMDDGSIASAGAKIATNSFKKEDLNKIIDVIKKLYNINSTINKCGKKDQYIIYFPKASMPLLSNLIKKYLVPSMYYKLNGF